MGKLSGLNCYLCGCMDLSIDGGIGWRNIIEKDLEKMEISVFNPAKKPAEVQKVGGETPEDRADRRKHKNPLGYKKFSKVMKMIRRIDLDAVEKSDILFCRIDLEEFACGTWEELFWANRLKRPIIVWCVQGKENAPDWLFGTLPHELIFSSYEESISYLQKVNSGKARKTYGRWKLLGQCRPSAK